MHLTNTLIDFANIIKEENHNILNPKIYLKHRLEDPIFEHELKKLINCEKVDFVLFSSRSGAEEHVDTHLTHLDIYTYIIPVILPNTNVVLNAEGEKHVLKIGQPVKINHQLPHSLVVTNDSPIVLVMASRIL